MNSSSYLASQMNLTGLTNITNELPTSDEVISLFKFIVLPFKILLSVVTTLLNLVIMIVIIFIIKRKTYSNMIFLSMATADFIVGIVSLPFMIIYSTFGYWPLGYAFCVAWCINDWTSGTVTLYSMLMISAHRYFQIKAPLKTNEDLTKWRCIRIIALWPLALCCWLTSILSITLTNDFDPASCYFTYTFAFVLSSDLFVFIIPVCLIVAFNILIYFSLKSRPKPVPTVQVAHISPLHLVPRMNTPMSFVKKTGAGQESQVNSTSNHLRSSVSVRTPSTPNQNRHKHDRNAFKCLICILVNLVINWCIFIVAWPITAICPGCVNSTAYEIGYWTTYIYSAINAIILFAFHESFRTGAKSLLSKFFIRTQEVAHDSLPQQHKVPSIRVHSVHTSHKI